MEMGVVPVQAVKKWRSHSLILGLVLIATWLLTGILRNDWPIIGLLIGLLLTLAALCIVATRLRINAQVAVAWKPWLFPVICTVLAFGMSVAGLNGSSSAYISWGVDGTPSLAGVIAGKPRIIRSDEWMVHTPWLLSQARQEHPFSAHNPSIGDKRVPLLCNLPVGHWSILFRPELLIFWLGLNPETAFAFFWNFKWWCLLCGSYSLLFLVTRGESFLSAIGALILLWTATIQWWFSSPSLMPDMVGLWCFSLAAGVLAVIQSKRWLRFLLAAAYVFCAFGFLFCCYPPFQIPLLTLFAPLLVALVLDRKSERRWITFGIATGVVIIGTTVFAWQLRDTFFTILSLVYPGRRFSTGGGVPWTSAVDGFLTLGASELHYPGKFENVVAAASCINPLPLLACVYVMRWRRGPNHDIVQLVLLAFAGLVAFFALFGIPRFLATISFWSFVTTERLSVTVALLGVLAVCRFLNTNPDPIAIRRLSWPALVGIFVFGVVLIVRNDELDGFVTRPAILAIWLFYSIAGLFLVAKIRVACLSMILLPLALLNGGVNPLSHGIPGYETTSISSTIRDLHKAYPKTRWVVLGAFPRATVISSLLKTTGATVLSGVIAIPEREMLDRLDPRHEHTEVYSRYASVCFVPAPDSATAPEFELQQTTVYSIRLPLTAEWLGRAGIDGLVVFDVPDLKVPENFHEVASRSGFRFLVKSVYRKSD